MKKEKFNNMPIREIFTLGTKKFVIKEDINCNSCYFNKLDCCKLKADGIIPNCSKRKDNKTVIFKEAK